MPESNVFCFDINISNFKYKSKKIHVFGIDINNQEKTFQTINKIFDRYKIKEFDIIIDDGSHKLSDILISIKIFFKFLKSNGLYVIEDFKHPNYYPYNKDINHIYIDELLKNLKMKQISFSNILSEKVQMDLMSNIDQIEIFKGNLNDSDISFISKR